MRLSANRDDPGYKALRAMGRYGASPLVTVNGVEVSRCITADTKRGIAVVYDLDGKGRVQLNAKHAAAKRKVLVGQVAITFIHKAR